MFLNFSRELWCFARSIVSFFSRATSATAYFQRPIAVFAPSIVEATRKVLWRGLLFLSFAFPRDLFISLPSASCTYPKPVCDRSLLAASCGILDTVVVKYLRLQRRFVVGQNCPLCQRPSRCIVQIIAPSDVRRPSLFVIISNLRATHVCLNYITMPCLSSSRL